MKKPSPILRPKQATHSIPRNAPVSTIPWWQNGLRFAGRLAKPVGFSLIEVTIALGVVSFAVTAILALLPAGLTHLRSSMDQTVEALIVKNIATRSLMADYSNLTGNELFFTERGQPTDNEAEARFVVTVEQSDPIFPGSAKAASWSQVATKLKISVVLLRAPGVRETPSVHQLLIANSGK